MMKKFTITLILSVLVQFTWAQDKLTRVESRDITRRAADAELSFHDQEMARLLIPKKTELGVLCVPSFTPEWAITLDSEEHALVLKESEENIWYHKRGFDHWNEYTHKKGEKRPKQYKSPKVKTYQLTIAADMVPLLNAIWKSAIGTAVEKDRNVITFDGTNWKYFINGEQAESRYNKNPLVAFTNELKQAIIAGNRSQAESLIGSEFQRVVSNLDVQTKYTERLDSIVVRDDNQPEQTRKFEFSYTEEGKVERILYYDRNENETWSLTNKREFFYDEQGNDTLCVLSFLSNDGEWETGEKSYNTYGSDGKMLRSGWVDGLDREKGLQMESYRDYLYDEQGRLQSTSDYWKRNGERKKTDITHYEYDAKGCQVKVESEDLEASPKSKNVEIKRYDEKGRLTASVDSIYDGKEAREWKRCEVSYNGDWMNEVKIIIKTIDHGEKESMQDYLFDAQGNLLQARIYRRTGQTKWTHVFSETYIYDLNQEGASIMGNDLIPKMVNLRSPLYMDAKYHHKLMQKSRLWHLDEDEDDEDEDETAETRLYYTLF